jgi:hypothetical protein
MISIGVDPRRVVGPDLNDMRRRQLEGTAAHAVAG